MKKIGVMGGTFDPCHRGHINLAIDAKNQAALDKIILMPNRIQPLKQDKEVTSANHRLNMLKAATHQMKDTEVSSWEIEEEGVSYTYKTLDYLKKKMGENYQVYFILGTDALLGIERWKNAPQLISENKFIVGVRPGYKLLELNEMIKKLQDEYNCEILKIANKKFHISSTEIRRRLLADESISDLVNHEVERYIRSNGLYI